MPAIEILGLEKTYRVGFWRKRQKCALRPLHLQVEDGEIFGFLGPNGAGKTTTLKLLMGLVFPTSGWARILGKEWTDPEVKAQIGFLPEQPYFLRSPHGSRTFELLRAALRSSAQGAFPSRGSHLATRGTKRRARRTAP